MSSVGQAIGGLVGGVVGFLVGGPTGAMYGAQIGMMAGGLLDPPKVMGPRLSDLSQQSATYDAFIPRAYGTVALYGNVFWLQGDKLTETKSTQSGKGGPEVTTFKYSATFAVGLCEGPIAGVRRIWVGSNLWYDAGSSDFDAIIASNSAAGGFTLYLGTEDQQPDPLMQADKGAANVPAYRGLAYLVLENFPLEKYSNSLMAAQVKVEVVTIASSTADLRLEGYDAGTGSLRSLALDGNLAYCADFTTKEIAIYSVADLRKPRKTGSISMTYGPVTTFVKGDRLYATESNALYVFNKHTLELLGSESVPGSTTLFVDDNYRAFITQSYPHNLRIYDVSDPANIFLKGSATNPYSTPNWVDVVDGYAYVTSNGTYGLAVFDVRNLTYGPVLVGQVADFGTKVPYCVKVQGNYAFVATDPQTLRAYDISNKAAPTFLSNAGTGSRPHRIALSKNYAFVADYTGTLAQKISAIDISNPSSLVFVDEQLTSEYGPTEVAVSGSMVYSVTTQGDFNAMVFAENLISSSLIPLSSIVQAECLKSDLLTAADLDVTALTDSVRGFRVSQLAPLRGNLDPLRRAWPFDVRQHGYKIQFVKRDGASVATVPAEDLDARDAGTGAGVSIEDGREMALMLPRQVLLKYLDAAREYDINIQEQSRT